MWSFKWPTDWAIFFPGNLNRQYVPTLSNIENNDNTIDLENENYLELS